MAKLHFFPCLFIACSTSLSPNFVPLYSTTTSARELSCCTYAAARLVHFLDRPRKLTLCGVATITINQLSASAPSRRHHTYTPVSRYGQQAGCTIDSFAGAQAFHRTVSHPHTIVRARWMKQKHGSKVVSSFCCR